MKARKRNFPLYVLLFQLLMSGLLHANPVYIGYSDYQIVTDFSFNAPKYFKQMQRHGINFQRIWVLGYSGSLGGRTERLPFVREGGKYDLSRIDPVYKNRLRNVLRSADRYGQRVMLTLFDHWSLAKKEVFLRGPWYYKNGKQRLLSNALPDFFSLRNRKLMKIQRDYVREIVEATAEFHPIYEIMNEGDWKPDCELVDRWHQEVAQWILEQNPDAEIAINVSNECSKTFEHSWVDVISLHGTQWLNEGICPIAGKYSSLNKRIIIDTDGAWKLRAQNDLLGEWLSHTLDCGASFNHKDDIYHLDFEALGLMQTAREKLNSADD